MQKNRKGDGCMYFVMKDYGKSDINKLAIYIEELPMDLGMYDSFRITCVDTNDTIIYKTTPDDTSRKTKSVIFNGLDDYDLVGVLVEYKLIGQYDYTLIGNYMFDVLKSSKCDVAMVNGVEEVVNVMHMGIIGMDGGVVELINREG